MATEEDTTNTVPLTLELLGGTAKGHDALECQRLPTPSGFKLQVLLPTVMDLEIATNTADMLLSSIENISNNVTVDRVELVNLRFTPQGISSLKMFLAIQATSVKHLVLNNVIGDDGPPNDDDDDDDDDGIISKTDQEQAFSSLGLAFQESRLETLDLGSNVLDSYIWKSFSSQTQLQSLFLEDVKMDDESFEVLDMHLAKKMQTGILSRLCISNNSVTTTEKAAQAGNNILYRCTHLRAIRWLNKNATQGSTCSLPCRGINELAQKAARLSTQLRHLELEGANELPDEEFDVNGLCGGLKLLHRLHHLKLRNMSITPHQATQLVLALKTGRIPLRNLDLSQNKLGDQGAVILGQLADIRSMVTNLKYLNIEANDIGNLGGIQLFSALGSRGFDDDLDIRTDGNRLDMVKVALGIAALRREAGEQRDELRLEIGQFQSGKQQQQPAVRPEDQNNARQLLAAQASMVSDMQLLQKQVETLTDERDSLIKAFSVMGAVQHVEERKSVLARLSWLEESIPGNNRANGRYSTNMQKSPSGLSPEQMRASQNGNMQPPGSVKRRPGAIKDGARQEERMSREEVRSRVLAEVTSLQEKKDEVRSRIMSEVVALQSERRKQQNDKTQVLQAKIKEKLASKAVDRAKVLEDVVKLKQERGLQRRESDSFLLGRREPADRSLPQRGNSYSEKSLQRREPANRILPQRGNSYSEKSLQRREPADRKLPQRGNSYSEKSLQRKESFSEKDSSRNRRESFSRSGSEMLESGGPTILIPDSSNHSSEGRNSMGQSTSDRFQRLLHKQIQNQLFKSTARNEDSLKSESERNSSARSGLRRTLSKAQEDSIRSLPGDASTQSPSLHTSITNGKLSSGMSLPGARPTPFNRDSQLDDSIQSLQVSDLSRGASPTILSSSRKSTMSPSVKTPPT
jgi:hypothetical protein